ncbi:response regulator [Magnetococcales bacterium HHB-1]
MEKKLALVTVFDLAGFSKKSKDVQQEVRKTLDKGFASAGKIFPSEVDFSFTGDGYVITIFDINIPFFIDFIDSLSWALLEIERRYAQSYRMGVDIGILSLEQNQLTNKKEHFEKVGIVAARLEEAGKFFTNQDQSSILFSERSYQLFSDHYGTTFHKREIFTVKDRKIYGYKFDIKIEGEVDHKRNFRRFIFGDYSFKLTKSCYTIMHVEDEHIFATDIQFMLRDLFEEKRKDIHLISAANGTEGLAHFQKNNEIDLILYDLRMPEMEGPEMMKLIREIKPDVLAIVITAMAHHDYDYGNDVILSKPVSEHQLHDYIQSLIGLFEESGEQIPDWFAPEVRNKMFEIRQIVIDFKDHHRLHGNIASDFLLHNAARILDDFINSYYLKRQNKLISVTDKQLRQLYSIANTITKTKKTNDSMKLTEMINEKVNELTLIHEEINIKHSVTSTGTLDSINRHDTAFLVLLVFELLDNAVTWSLKQKSPTIKLSIAYLSIRNELLIKVRNQGDEIKKHVKENMFKKGFSEKRRGSGLGLYLVSNIVHKQKGSINYSRIEDDNVFTLIYPVVPID